MCSLKEIVSINQGGSKAVSINRYCPSNGVPEYFYLVFFINVLQLLEPKLLVMCERIGEALKMICSTYLFEKI
jgi:hypothetical protein